MHGRIGTVLFLYFCVQVHVSYPIIVLLINLSQYSIPHSHWGCAGEPKIAAFSIICFVLPTCSKIQHPFPHCQRFFFLHWIKQCQRHTKRKTKMRAFSNNNAVEIYNDIEGKKTSSKILFWITGFNVQFNSQRLISMQRETHYDTQSLFPPWEIWYKGQTMSQLTTPYHDESCIVTNYLNLNPF